MASKTAQSHWASEEIYSEAVCPPDEVYYEGSDDEYYESPDIRKARLEAAARSFLHGDEPFLLSSTLKGPFDATTGWLNPWQSKRLKPQEAVESKASPCRPKKRRVRVSRMKKAATTRNARDHRDHRDHNVECHLPSPESVKQAPSAPHPFMEEDEVTRVHSWRSNIEQEAPSKDLFWAGDNMDSASPRSRSAKRKRAQGSDWLKKATSKRHRFESQGDEDEDMPLRRSERISVSASPPKLQSASQASIRASSKQQPYKDVLRSSQSRSRKNKKDSEAEDELISSFDSSFNSNTKKQTPTKRSSPHSGVLRSTQRSNAYSEDELAHDNEVNMKAAATLSSPVSNTGVTTRAKNAEPSSGTKPSRPRKRRSIRISQKVEPSEQEKSSQNTFTTAQGDDGPSPDVSPERETQRDNSFCYKRGRSGRVPSPHEVSDHESTSSLSSDHGENDATADAESPKLVDAEVELGHLDAVPSESISVSFRNTPTTLEQTNSESRMEQLNMENTSPSNKMDDDASSSTSESESEVDALSSLSETGMRALSVEVRDPAQQNHVAKSEPSTEQPSIVLDVEMISPRIISTTTGSQIKGDPDSLDSFEVQERQSTLISPVESGFAAEPSPKQEHSAIETPSAVRILGSDEKMKTIPSLAQMSNRQNLVEKDETVPPSSVEPETDEQGMRSQQVHALPEVSISKDTEDDAVFGQQTGEGAMEVETLTRPTPDATDVEPEQYQHSTQSEGDAPTATQSPWAKSQYTQFLYPSMGITQTPYRIATAHLDDLEKVEQATPTAIQSPQAASQGPVSGELGQQQEKVDLQVSEDQILVPNSSASRQERQSTPENLTPFRPFSNFMTPSPERIARRKLRGLPRISGGSIRSSQLLASAMKNPWSSSKFNRRVSWAPLPHEVAVRGDSPSVQEHKTPEPHHGRPLSPPPNIPVAQVTEEIGEDRFRDHFQAVARRVKDGPPSRILPTASQQTVGSPDAFAMAENFIASDEMRDKQSDVHSLEEVDDTTTINMYNTGFDTDDLTEDVFNNIQELLQPWNLDAELEQARKENEHQPMEVDIWSQY